jgi:hypothetical protein
MYDSQPSRARISGLMKRGLPAKADGLEYGELPINVDVGFRGRNCQIEAPDEARLSAKA